MKSKFFVSLFLLFAFLVSTICCSGSNPNPRETTKYGMFDTFSTVQSYSGDNEKDFEDKSSQIYKILDYYNRQFDIYNEYPGANNLCTINKNAGITPVAVDVELIDFLEYSIDLCKKCNMEINIAMGSVLKLWHDARENATDGDATYIPSQSELDEANKHTDINSIVINRNESTVFITDKDASIDVGAIGKGYAVMMATNYLRKNGYGDGYVINVGGNISVLGTKVGGDGWITGITNPDRESDKQFAARVRIADTSCVTSGNYERYFEYNGKKYHHIIDKDTLQPAEYFSSVTVICDDSGIADALSTALFCMSIEDGMTIIAQFEDVEVLWITLDGTIEKTKGFDLIA